MRFAAVLKVLFLCTWLVAVGAGYYLLIQYKGTLGSDGNPPVLWPRDSTVPLDPRVPTLVMLAHPRCACTEASLEGLARFLERHSGRVRAHILFLRPKDVAHGWEQGSLWRQACALPQALVKTDDLGHEASRFRVGTSGHVLLYRPDGRLLFSGGITPARGHAGDSRGLDQLGEVLDKSGGPTPSTAVFGCPLKELNQ
jgi:hypothetical protein